MSMQQRIGLLVAVVVIIMGPLSAYALYFGGTVFSKPLPCNGLSGYYHARIVLPGFFDGEVMWGPGSKFYLNGPYHTAGQNGLGSLSAPAPCDVKGGKTPKALLIDTAPGAGSSGEGSSATPAAPPASQCTEPTITDGASQVLAEQAMRDRLRLCSSGGITVTGSKTPLPCPYGVNGVKAGCTSVGGLQCKTADALCDLYKKCGAFTIIGGSESGHLSHGSGGAVDIRSANADSNFGSCLKQSGVKVLDEDTGTTPLSTGPHWHICTGVGC